MRLIDADALDNKLEVLKVRLKALGRDNVVGDYNFAQTVLLTAPTVDAVEVVRCKDCKSWIPYGPGSLGTCRNCNFSDKPITHANHFCAYGERKGND